MVRLGKVYRNLMVDLKPTNEKLRKRAIRLVSELAEVDPALARTTLLSANWEVKTAVLVLRTAVSPSQAREILAAAGGLLGAALRENEGPDSPGTTP